MKDAYQKPPQPRENIITAAERDMAHWPKRPRTPTPPQRDDRGPDKPWRPGRPR